jgi:predicted amidohydrolase
MKIGYCQFNVVNSDIDSNLNKIKELLKNISAGLIVLPELCMTGYYFSDRSKLAQLSNKTNQEKILSTLTRIAKNNGSYIVAGITELENNDLYNTAIVIGPNGSIGKHRKVNITKNEKIFTRGTKFDVFEIDKVKIGIAICFDSWFPESFRLLSLQGAQIICCPSNFGGPWTLDVMKVRSLENQVFTVMSNRTGYEMIGGEKAEFRGESQVIDYGGNILIKAENNDCVGIVDINPNEANQKGNIICDDMKYEMSLYKEYVTYTI